jgi:hypothetical protein
MEKFKIILYGRMLYETLRNYYSVNYKGQMSILYKYIIAIVSPLQAPFDAFNLARIKSRLIAQCKWQMGQLTNVLNFLYDPLLTRIYIDQSVASPISATTFAYTAILQAYVFDEISTASLNTQARTFFDQATKSDVIVHVPDTVNIPDITATLEQIKIQGIPYQIEII